MNDKFILLTTIENHSIIIGVSNIALIEPDLEKPMTIITLNFARNKDLWPKTIIVKETFEQIKKMINL